MVLVISIVGGVLGSVIAAALVYGITFGINKAIKRITDPLKDMANRFEDMAGRFKDMANRFEDMAGRFEDMANRFEDMAGRFEKMEERNNKASFDGKIAMMHAYMADVKKWKKESDLDIAHVLNRIETDLKSAVWIKDFATIDQKREVNSVIKELIQKLEVDECYKEYPTQIAKIKTVLNDFQS